MKKKHKLVLVRWTDVHNNAGQWMNEEELQEFAKDEVYKVTQVGYLVYEDDECVLIASRITQPHENYSQSFGQVERIPKRLIDEQEELWNNP